MDLVINSILSAYDAGEMGVPEWTLEGPDAHEARWLMSSLHDRLPANPFQKGSRAHQEAEEVRELLQAAPDKAQKILKALNPVSAGSHAALWHWGRAIAVNMPKPFRHQWENLLLSPAGNAITRGWALRHALCYALAEGDEMRYSKLREWFAEDGEPLFKAFQRAFSLLGGPAPRYFLWSLPGLLAQDLPLQRLGQNIWISPVELPPSARESGFLWIIPALRSNLAREEATLDVASRQEGEVIAKQMEALKWKGQTLFAPSRAPFEESAFVFFPVVILLDKQGHVRQIIMGDAAKVFQGETTQRQG